MNKRQLIDIAEQGLRDGGWMVERTGGRNTSERRIVRGNERLLISIRTSRDAYFGFGPSGVSPEDYDFVVVSSVDQKENPTEVRVHQIPGRKVAEAIAAHREARRAHGDRGELAHNWLSLYTRDYGGRYPDRGAGLGLDFPPIHRVALGLLGEPLDTSLPRVERQEPATPDRLETVRQILERHPDASIIIKLKPRKPQAVIT
jgi:hypothetical protein